MDRLAAAVADRYRILREVGSGGMATVYLADDLRHGRQVALKVLRPELAATLGPERFFREIHVAARLQHPHILPLHDSGEAAGFLYFIMPFVSGESLRERLDRTNELPVGDTVRILIQVADALAYSHAQGVVHRDIKPDNIMLSSRHAMLMDFGVAKAVHDAAGQSTVTTAGVALGTPTYMAPEQATADPQLDHRVDIYALGVVAYEMLTGRPPFSGLSPQQVLAAHVTRTPDSVVSLRDSCPSELDAVVMRCLAKRPADRFQSAEALLHALEPLSVSSGGVTPTQTRPASTAAREPTVAQPAGNRRRVYGLAALVAAVALAGTWLAGTSKGGVVASIPAGSLDRTQITSSGEAFAGALSPDGQRIVYAERVCDSAGSCTSDVRVQDVSGVGETTLLRGLTGVGEFRWSADGRWLLMHATMNGRYGAYSLPSIGGDPRFLGCCNGTNTVGDTAVVTVLDGRGQPSLLRFVTMADGIVRDSILVGDEEAKIGVAWQVPETNRLLVAAVRDQGLALLLMDRAGTVLDSMLTDRGFPLFGGFSVRRDAFSIAIGGDERGNASLLWYRFDGADRIEKVPVHIVEGVAASNGLHISPDGTMTISNGPLEHALWSIERATPADLNFQQTLVGRSTSGITGSITNDGQQILIVRNKPSDPNTREFAIRGFTGGAEKSLGAWEQLIDWDFSQDGGQLLAVRRVPEAHEVIEIDTRSGQMRSLGKHAADARWYETVQGGGYVFVKGLSSLALRGVAARADTVFESVGQLGQLLSLEPSPDGRYIAVAGWSENLSNDSALIATLDLRTGIAAERAAFPSEGIGAITWMSNGALLIPVYETQHTEGWYQLNPDSNVPISLGLPPRSSATYRFSRNGLRGVAREEVQRSDVFILRGAGTPSSR